MRGSLLAACLLLGCAQDVESPAPVAPAASAPDASVAAEATKDLRHALAHSAKKTRVERRSERLHVDMAGTFQTATVIHFGADGQRSKLCIDDAAQLERMLGGSP